MIKFNELNEEIKETRRQIQLTKSKQRRWQLHRHLSKLQKQYSLARMYYCEAKKKAQQ